MMNKEGPEDVILKLLGVIFVVFLLFNFYSKQPAKGPVEDTLGRVDGDFFVTDEERDSGTGTLEIDQVWYSLGDNKEKNKEVLRYPKEGHVVGWGMAFDREFSSSYRKESISPLSIEVRFNAIYTNSNILEMGVPNSNELNELFSINKRVVYVWDSENNIFNLDLLQSEMTTEQIEGLYNDGNDGFLKHNFKELKEFIRNGDNTRQQWLQAFLKTCKDGQEKTELASLL